MDLFQIEKLRLRLIDEYYSRFYPNYSKTYQKDRPTTFISNRSPCTSLWRLFQSQILPIEKFNNPEVRINIVLQEVKNGILYCVVNSKQISRNRFNELFKGSSEVRRFRISLKNMKKIFSEEAVVYIKKRALKGEKCKIEQYFKNRTYF